MADKKLIAVIDDDPDILEVVQAILTGNGFDVKTAKSGAEGVTLVAEVKPDLVLCDMMMERIDSGSKTAAEIRRANPKVPIYLLSSIGDATASNIDVDKLGFNGVFQKPIYPDDFISEIKSALGI